MTVVVHMCRGNEGVAGLGSGGYDAIAERVFGRLKVDGYLLEYDTPRAGDFAPLRFLPKDTIAVLGLDQHQGSRARIQGRAQAPHRRGRPRHRSRPPGACARSAVSPPSTATTAWGSTLQERKLELLVSTARDIWG